MKGFKEIGIPLLVWVYFLSEGLRGALDIPSLNIEPKDPLPMLLKAIASALALLAGFVVVFINLKRRKMGFEYWLERKLSEESFRKISRRINFPILAGSFFGLIGFGGLAKALSIGAPQINKDILQVIASMSIGCFIAWLISWKAQPSTKSN